MRPGGDFKTRRFTERWTATTPQRARFRRRGRGLTVANGVVKGVRVLGQHSSNNRTYTVACMKDAVARKLYEGAAIFCNHLRSRDLVRRVEDRLGTLRNVRFEDGGLVGDIVLILAHPMAPRVLEAARRPELWSAFGLSHDAEGEVEHDASGRMRIIRLTAVKSCDLVAEPATVAGLAS